jgi:hypothetical protein
MILSGGGRHEWIDASHRRLTQELPAGYKNRDYQPMVCIDCGTYVWRERGTGRIQIVDFDDDLGYPRAIRAGFLRGLDGPEMGCEYMIVRRIMEG